MNRTRLLRPALAITASAWLIQGSSAAANDPECHRGPTVAAVQAQRETFNEAIANGDLDAIERVLAADVVLVAGTHSDRFLDRAAQLEVWQDDFEGNRDRLVYVRTPTCIRLSAVGPMASERGRWHGENAAGDFAAGSYSAKWRRIDADWRLEAEFFMTENCGGAACPEADD
jgi:ketosteroid isomerase-like protein